MGNYYNNSLLRLDPNLESLTTWGLGDSNWPEGMAFDSQGALWFAENFSGSMNRFWPDSNQLETYSMPSDENVPDMVAVQGDRVWYTDWVGGKVGNLDPAAAAYTTTTLLPETSTATPVCSQVSSSETANAPISHGILSWNPQTYNVVVDSGGWMVYQLPDVPFDAGPWGITANDTHVWFVDSNRQVLGELEVPPANNVYLPVVIK
jgi:streptogramin lyase